MVNEQQSSERGTADEHLAGLRERMRDWSAAGVTWKPNRQPSGRRKKGRRARRREPDARNPQREFRGDV